MSARAGDYQGMAETLTVAVLGTGTMGAPMAQNIAGAGHRVRVWNRSQEKAEALAGNGIEAAGSPAQAAEGADVLLTMLTDSDAASQVVADALGALADGAIWWQVGTVGLDGARALGELAQEAGVIYVDGPVSGTKQPAEQGELLILASGPDAALDRLEPLFAATGKAARRCGPAPGGSRLKLVLNAWLGLAVAGLAETVALARAVDLDPADLLDAIGGGPLDMPLAQLKGKAMQAHHHPTAFALDNQLKDLGFVADEASAAGLELTVLDAVRARYAKASQDGHGAEDLAAVAESI